MKRQPLSPKISQSLQKYLSEIDFFKYEPLIKQRSLNIINSQKYEKTTGSKEIWFATELGQPFLFWNENNTLDIGGVLNYDSEKQTGQFSHNTSKGKIFIENVHSYHVFVNIEGKYLPANSRYLPEYEETRDIYVSAIIREDEFRFKINIYHNNILIFEKTNVYPEEYIFYGENTAYKNRLAYVRFAEEIESSKFINYIYDIRKEKLLIMDDSKDMPSWYIDYRLYCQPEWCRGKEKIISEKNINIILHLDESKTSQIVSEYIRETADSYQCIPNLFEDDDTLNIKVTYNNRPEHVRFLYYCAKLYSDIFGNGLFDLSIDSFEKGSQNNRFEYKNILLIPEQEFLFYKNCNKLLYQRCGENIAINRLPLKIYEEYITSREMIIYMYQYLRDIAPSEYEADWILSYMGKSEHSFEKEREMYNAIFNKIAKAEKLSNRWKSEYELYKLVAKEYNDAVYQYHSNWLGRQSLDIFVPSQRIAFEYQGRQHYHAVKFFGGDTQLEKQKIRDAEKKRKCNSEGITLIEWKYDEPISRIILQEKLEQAEGL